MVARKEDFGDCGAVRNLGFSRTMKILYELKVIDEDEDVVIAKVSSYSEEGLTEEMGKSKISKALEDYRQLRLGQLAGEDEEKEEEVDEKFNHTHKV